MQLPNDINRMCERCAFTNPVTVDENSFICVKCGCVNTYDNETLKEALEELKRKIQKVRFKNPQNN